MAGIIDLNTSSATAECAEDLFADKPSAPFPVNCLPAVCCEMVRHSAKAALVPESLAAAAVLGVVSASLGSGLEVESGGTRRTRGNLFILPLAETGTGKDMVFNPIVGPLQRMEEEARSGWRRDAKPFLSTRVRVAEKKIKLLEAQAAKGEGNSLHQIEDAYRELDSAKRELVRCPTFIATEATREAMAADMASQAGEALSLMTPEGRGTLGVILGRYTKGDATDEDVYCAGFSGTSISQRRRTKEPVELKRPCLTILLMVQPDVWARLSGMEVMVASGLLPRFLTFDTKAEPEPLPPVPHRIPTHVQDQYAALIRALVEMYRLRNDGPLCIRCPIEAYDLLRDFDNECRKRRRTGGDSHDIAGFAARWAEHAWRLSVILHAMQHGDRSHDVGLAADTVHRAIELTRWFIDEQLVLLDANRRVRRKERAAKLEELIRNYSGSISMRDLGNSHGFKKEEVMSLSTHFPRRFTVRPHKPKTGRHGEVVTLTGPAPNH